MKGNAKSLVYCEPGEDLGVRSAAVPFALFERWNNQTEHGVESAHLGCDNGRWVVVVFLECSSLSSTSRFFLYWFSVVRFSSDAFRFLSVIWSRKSKIPEHHQWIGWTGNHSGSTPLWNYRRHPLLCLFPIGYDLLCYVHATFTLTVKAHVPSDLVPSPIDGECVCYCRVASASERHTITIFS